jgi:hypothetical protein
MLSAAAAAPPPAIGPQPRTAATARAAAAPLESARTRLRATAGSAPQIAPSNLGFRMLARAGWAPGTGLGANTQGPVEPVETFIKADRRGIGAETVSSLEVVGAAADAARKRPGRDAAQGAAAGGEGGAAGGTRKRSAGGAGKNDAEEEEEAPTQAELSREALAAFVRKRARDAAVQRRIFRDFADAGADGTVVSGVDTHPLTRPPPPGGGGDRLRARNPLRGMFDDA